MVAVNEKHLQQLLEINEPTERANKYHGWARSITIDSYNRAHHLLNTLWEGEGVDQRIKESRDILKYLLRKEAAMDERVERGPEQFRAVHMPDIPPVRRRNTTIREERCTKYGWPFDAQLIELNGKLCPPQRDQNIQRVIFVQQGELRLKMDDLEMDLGPNHQAAIPANHSFDLSGEGTLFILNMKPERKRGMSPDLVIGNFHKIGSDQNSVPERNEFPGYVTPCPCGWSRRIWLHEMGWDFDTHLTDLGHDANGANTESKFRGHQHRNTPEAYFGSDIQGDAQMLINGCGVPLRNGTFVLVPNGTMHAVDVPDGGKAEVRIFVGEGGHDDGDFYHEDWTKIEH